MKKALFWDFDGTLVYPQIRWISAFYNSVLHYGYDVSLDDVKSHMSRGYTWHNPENSYLDHRGEKWWEQLFDYFILFYDRQNISKAESEKINLHFKNQILDFKDYVLYEDAVQVLQMGIEKGYKNYMLSNNFPELPLIAERLGLSEYFTDCIVSANVGYEKPRKELFEYALALADFPDISYMIGDNPVADIKGGKAAGMKTVLVHTISESSGADCNCEFLTEIIKILE